MNKYNRLLEILKKMDSAIVAFSGGVDSSLLLKATHDALGSKTLAITAVSPSQTKEEIEAAKQISKLIGVKHILIKSNEFQNKNFLNNPKDRCYICKKIKFKKLLDYAHDHGFKHVLEGSNVDDLDDYRPGMKVVKELGILSPLIKANMTKTEIRKISKNLDLPVWNKPATSCLVTRIPYNQTITTHKLKRIDKAEASIKKLGFNIVRIRDFGNRAKIEIGSKELSKLSDEKIKSTILATVANCGYKHVNIDPEGYKKGSLLNL